MRHRASSWSLCPQCLTKTSLSQNNRVDPHAEHAALTTMAAADAPVYEAIVDQQERCGRGWRAVGQGTTCIIRLPHAQPGGSPPSPPTQAEHSKNVLMVVSPCSYQPLVDCGQNATTDVVHDNADTTVRR